MSNNKNMTDEEIDDMAHAFATAFSNTQNVNELSNVKSNTNVYQTFATTIGLIGSLCSIILTFVLENIAILFIGLFTSFVAFLFISGFGTIIQSTKSIDNNIQLIYNFLQSKQKKGD